MSLSIGIDAVQSELLDLSLGYQVRRLLEFDAVAKKLLPTSKNLPIFSIELID